MSIRIKEAHATACSRKNEVVSLFVCKMPFVILLIVVDLYHMMKLGIIVELPLNIHKTKSIKRMKDLIAFLT